MESLPSRFAGSLKDLQRKLAQTDTHTQPEIILKHLTEMSREPSLKACLELERSSWISFLKEVTMDDEEIGVLARIMRRKLQHRNFNEKRVKRAAQGNNNAEPRRKRNILSSLEKRVSCLETALFHREKDFNVSMNTMQVKIDKLERHNAYLLSQLNPDRMPICGSFDAFQYVDLPQIDSFLIK